MVDCYIDEKGNQIEKMSVNTRYLVLGEAPNEKGMSKLIAAFSKMRSDAERLGVQKIQLSDLLLRMGWKNQTPTVRFGPGSNLKDFGAKPGAGASDGFQPREAPAGPSGAYYRFH